MYQALAVSLLLQGYFERKDEKYFDALPEKKKAESAPHDVERQTAQSAKRVWCGYKIIRPQTWTFRTLKALRRNGFQTALKGGLIDLSFALDYDIQWVNRKDA